MIDLKLNPDATLLRVQNDKIQLRSPDGRHLTFQDEDSFVTRVLERLQEGVSDKDIKGLREEYTQDFIDGILEPLQQRGLLAKAKDWSVKSQYERLIASYVVQGGKAHDILLPKFVHIIGQGEIADTLRDIFGAVSATDGKQAGLETLIIGASDTDDTQAMVAVNARIIESNQLGTFVRWRSREFILGPFVCPRETACYDCAEHRGMAAALYVDEASAYKESGKSAVYSGGHVLDSLLRALVERHVGAILSGVWSLACPGYVQTTDPLTLETVKSNILRLPRCHTCGSVDEESPDRAVRDLT